MTAESSRTVRLQRARCIAAPVDKLLTKLQETFPERHGLPFRLWRLVTPGENGGR